MDESLPENDGVGFDGSAPPNDWVDAVDEKRAGSDADSARQNVPFGEGFDATHDNVDVNDELSFPTFDSSDAPTSLNKDTTVPYPTLPSSSSEAIAKKPQVRIASEKKRNFADNKESVQKRTSSRRAEKKFSGVVDNVRDNHVEEQNDSENVFKAIYDDDDEANNDDTYDDDVDDDDYFPTAKKTRKKIGNASRLENKKKPMETRKKRKLGAIGGPNDKKAASSVAASSHHG